MGRPSRSLSRSSGSGSSDGPAGYSLATYGDSSDDGSVDLPADGLDIDDGRPHERDVVVGGTLSKKQTTALLARQVLETARDAKMWSPDELLVGLSYLKEHHNATRPLVSRPAYPLPEQDQIVATALHYGALAFAVYAEDDPGLEARLPRGSGLDAKSVRVWVRSSALNRPGFMIVVDERRQEVVLAVRGTDNMSDILTDVSASSMEKYGGRVHTGFAQATAWFREQLWEADSGPLRVALAEHPGYSLRTVGHSLGGAIASMVAVDLMHDVGCSVSAVVFAPGAGFSLGLGAQMASFVTAFVLHTDVVPRFSTAHVETLRQELKGYPWRSMWVANQKDKLRRAMPGKSKPKPADPSRPSPHMARQNPLLLREKHGMPMLYPPGNVYHIAQDSASGTYFLRHLGSGSLVEAEFSHIELEDAMFDSHRMGNYLGALEQCQGEAAGPPVAHSSSVFGRGGGESGSESGSESSSSSSSSPGGMGAGYYQPQQQAYGGWY